MSDEIKMTMPEGVEPEATQAPAPQDTAPEYSEIEQEAMALGWKPESEFTPRNGKKWKTAEKFLEDKPLFDKIDEQHKVIKKLERSQELLRQHYEKVEKAAYERAVAELKAERKLALEEGDLVRAEEIRDQIEETKAAAPKPKPVEPDPEIGNAMDQWRGRNDWYEKDEDLTAFADGLGNKLLAKGEHPVKILETVEKKVREAFPQKFRNPNRDAAPRVESGSTKKGKSAPDDSLTAEETRIMESLIRSGAPITRDEYIRDLRKTKGIK